MPPESIVYNLLDRTFLYRAEDVHRALLLRDAPFSSREGIRSVLVFPLRARSRKVGVLFVNFRRPRRFSRDEISTTRMFADQIATGIQNHQEYSRQRRRVQALKSIYDAGQAAMVDLASDLDELIADIARQAISIVGFDPEYTDVHRCFSHVGLVDGNRLYFSAACPRDEILKALRERWSDGIDLTAMPEPSTIAALAVNERKTLNISNVSSNEAYVRLSNKTRSQLSVPFFVQDRVLGVISIEHPADNAFQEEDIKNVEALATWVGAAVKRARLQYTLDKVAELSIVDDTQQTLSELAEGIKDISRCELVVLYRYNSQTETVDYPPARTQLKNPEVVSQIQGNAPHASVLTVMNSKEYHIINDPESDPYFESNQFVKAEEIRSAIAIPLRAVDRIQGVIFLNYYSKHDFSNEEIDTVRLLAKHAGVTLHNISLLHSERRARLQSEALQDVSEVVTSEIELSRMGEQILEKLQRVVRFKTATVQRITYGGRREIIAKNFSEDRVSPYLLRPLSEDSLVDEIIESGSIRVISSTEKYTGWESNLESTRDVASWVGVPLIYKDISVGFLTLDHDEPGYFTGYHGKLLAPFANQIAFAIGNQQLIDTAHSFNAALTRVHSIGNAIAQHAMEELDLERLYENIYRSFDGLFPETQLFYIAEYDRQEEIIRYPLVVEDKVRISDDVEWEPHRSSVGLVLNVIENGEPVLLPRPNLDTGPWLAQHGIDAPDIRFKSWVGAPMLVGSRSMGAVVAEDHTREFSFDPGVVEILEAFASQCAVALEYVRSRTLLGQIIQYITNLYKIGDEDEVFAEVAFRIVETLKCDAAGICMLEKNKLVVREVFSIQTSVGCPPGTEIPRSDLITWGALNDRELAYGTVSDTNDTTAFFCDNVKSAVAAPLYRDGQAVGVLRVENIDWEQFTLNATWTNMMVSLFADVASAALTNVRHIEQERRARDFLALADSAIVGGALARSVIHELNNGLSTVDALLFDITSQLNSLQNIKGTKKLLQTVDDARSLLEQISVDRRVIAFTGRLQPRYEIIRFNDVVRDTIDFVESLLKRYKITFDTDLDPRLDLAVEVDVNQIRQVILNFVLNSIDAYQGQGFSRNVELSPGNKAKGKLIFRTKSRHEVAEFQLEDFASGISEMVINQMFEPFVTSKNDGAGLGLYVSRIIIEENHRGSIDFHPKSLGSVFYFRIPYATN